MTDFLRASPTVVADKAEPYLDNRTKFFYGVGGIANATKTVLFGLFTLYFYTSVMGLSGTLVGIASAIGLAWDAVIDPYIGYLSDRIRSRFGRRHTLMLIGSLTMGVSFWVFLSPPQGLPTWPLFAWLIGASLLVRTATSVYGVPYYALGAELSQDYHERTSITAVRGVLALLGTLAVAALSFVVFFPDDTPGVDPKLNYAGYPAMGLTFGLVMTVAGLIATFGTLAWQSRNTQTSLQLPDSARSNEAASTFLGSLVQSLSNTSFRVLFISFSLFFLGVVVNSALSIHYFTYYAKILGSTALSTFQVAFYLGGAIGVVFWLQISQVVEKHRLYVLATLATACVMMAAYFLIGEGHPLGTGNVQVLTIGHAVAGFFASIIWFMPASMIADVADEDELATGQRREGSFFGIFLLGQQLAAGLSLLLTGVLVDWFADLVPGQATQTAQTVERIGLLYSLLPAALLGIAAVLILRYDLSRERVTVIRAELDHGHARTSRAE